MTRPAARVRAMSPTGNPVFDQRSIRKPKPPLAALVNGRLAIDEELAVLDSLWRGAFRQAIEAADVPWKEFPGVGRPGSVIDMQIEPGRVVRVV